jgi:hypothetical protein
MNEYNISESMLNYTLRKKFKDENNIKNSQEMSYIYANNVINGTQYDMKTETILLKLLKEEFIKKAKFSFLYYDNTKIVSFDKLRFGSKFIKMKNEIVSNKYRNILQELISSVSNLNISEVAGMLDDDIMILINKNRMNNKNIYFTKKIDIPPFIDYLNKIETNKYEELKIVYPHREIFKKQKNVIKEVSRIVKDGGIVKLIDYDIKYAKDQTLVNLAYQIYGYNKYYTCRSFSEWERIMNENGFETIEVKVDEYDEFIATFKLNKLKNKYFNNNPHLKQAIETNEEKYVKYNENIKFINEDSLMLDKDIKEKSVINNIERCKLIYKMDIINKYNIDTILNIDNDGRDLIIIKKLYPNIKIIAYNYNKTWNKELKKNGIKVFNDDISLEIFKQYKNLNLAFFSNEIIKEEFIKELNPKVSVLNVNIKELKTYLKGKIYIPAWFNTDNNNALLLIEGKIKKENYDVKKIIKQIRYFQVITRSNYYLSNYFFIDHCYDCVSESHILKEYAENNNLNIDNIKLLSENITDMFSELKIIPNLTQVGLFYDLELKKCEKYNILRYEYNFINFNFEDEKEFYDNINKQTLPYTDPFLFYDISNIYNIINSLSNIYNHLNIGYNSYYTTELSKLLNIPSKTINIDLNINQKYDLITLFKTIQQQENIDLLLNMINLTSKSGTYLIINDYNYPLDTNENHIFDFVNNYNYILSTKYKDYPTINQKYSYDYIKNINTKYYSLQQIITIFSKIGFSFFSLSMYNNIVNEYILILKK